MLTFVSVIQHANRKAMDRVDSEESGGVSVGGWDSHLLRNIVLPELPQGREVVVVVVVVVGGGGVTVLGVCLLWGTYI